MFNIAVIDDEPHMIEAFKNHFAENATIHLAYTAPSIEVFEAEIPNMSSLNVLFLDINLPNESGLEALPRLKERLPETDIIMFTVHEDKESLIKALCRGATGYLLKDTSVADVLTYLDILQKGGSVISASMAKKLIEGICNNQKPLAILNEKEYQVLELLAEGWSYKLIAGKVGISVDGVRFYIKRIYRALNVNSKGEAIHLFYKNP
jgi:DNA-binding NarL/FixJ family response regulator